MNSKLFKNFILRKVRRNSIYTICTILFFVLFTITSFSQSNINSYKELYFIENEKELISFLDNIYSLNEKNISLKKEYEVESLTGKHITFSLLYNNIELKYFIIKVHINKQNQIYFLQENVTEIKQVSTKDHSFNSEILLRNLKNDFTISSISEMYILTENNIFEKALILSIYNENLDIYLERTYRSNTEYNDKDLKVHFEPFDTTIFGSVFLPDPLTTAESPYEGNYQDSYKKDTQILVIDTIPNTGQTTIVTSNISYTLHGESGIISSQSVTNTFSGSNVFLILNKIYLDGVSSNIGYDVQFVDDLIGLETEINIEDYDYFELNAEQFDIEVLGDYSTSEFKLKNTFFEITHFSPPAIAPYNSSINNFSFKRQNDAFEEINAFYHLNNFHSYIEKLGYVNLDPQIVKVDVHANNGTDNSFFTYLPKPRLAFGDGGVDDAEDASVVIHEYAHALSHFASPETNEGAERKALDEALGDYFASSYNSQFSNFTKGQVFPWDGHNEFWAGRISNSDSTYDNYNDKKSIYYNAQIMSSTLMDILNKIGKENTDILVLEAMFFNTKNNTFKDFTTFISIANKELFDFKFKQEIDKVFIKRKFLKEGNEKNEKGYLVEINEDFTKGGKATIYIIEENFEKMDFWISNSIGKIVFKEENITTPKIEIDSKLFYRGIYYLRIQTTKNKYKTKLLKP